MDSLQDILGKKKLEAPDEMGAIRDYISRRYQSKCFIKLQRDALIVSVRSSALAATLQLERQNMIEACNITRKLVIRAG